MATKQTTRSTRARTPHRSRKTSRKSGMCANEITPLVLEAKDAYAYQEALGNIDPGVTFEAWRREQCLEAVGKPGLSKCKSDDWQDLAAHFCVLAGKDAEALSAADQLAFKMLFHLNNEVRELKGQQPINRAAFVQFIRGQL